MAYEEKHNKKRHLFKMSSMLFGQAMVVVVVIVSMFTFFFLEFHDMSKRSEQTAEDIVPYVLQAQKIFINIDTMRFLIADLRESTGYTNARNSFYSAQAIFIDMNKTLSSVSSSDRSELQRQLQMFWYKRLRLEELRTRYINYLSEIVVSGLEITKDEPKGDLHNTFVDWIRHMAVGFGNTNAITDQEISEIRRLGSMVSGQCNFDGDRRGLSLPCKRFDDNYRRLILTLNELQENIIEFNVIYDYFRSQLNAMVLEASTFENMGISSYLNEKRQLSENSEVAVVACLVILLIVMLAMYELTKRYIVMPITVIVRMVRISQSKMHKPKTFPHSPVAEIDEIFSMLPKIFDDLHQSQDEVKKSNKNYLKLLDVSMRDELTGTLNRRALETFMSRNSMVPSGLCVMMVDIDHFKSFNDERGHQYGDYILKLIAATLMNSLSEKNNDRVFRFGGEEFVIMVQNIESRMRKAIAERLCDRVRALQVPNAANDTGLLTISVGCSTVTTGDSVVSITSLISQADVALYEAKSLGRNRVILASGKETSTDTKTKLA